MNLSSFETFGEEEKSINTQKVSVSNQINSSLHYPNIKSDSFNLDMERFSHLTTNDFTPNSRITLQRNLSRKGSQRGVEKKMNSSADNERDTSILVPNSSSPKAAFVGTSTLEKPIVVTVGATTNHPINQQIHHQITITSPAAAAASTVTAESKLWGKRHSFKRSSSSWTVDPRRILFYFATLSSMGTILLIYFTLSMGKLSGDDNILIN